MGISSVPGVPGITLIGIYGKAGSGKDTVADYIESRYRDTYTEHFADALKECASKAFGIPLEHFYDPKLKEQVNDYWGTTPRKIAQFVGTELFRDNIWKILKNDQGDFWIRRLAGKLTGESRLVHSEGDYTPGDIVVIPDLRFQNEYDFVVGNCGIVICLTREGANGEVGISNHPSETCELNITHSLSTFQIENNGTLEELYSKVDQVIEQSGLNLISKTEVNENV